MVLSYSAYTETLEKQRKKDNDITEMKYQIKTIMNTLEQLLMVNQNDTTKDKLARDLIEKGMYVSNQ